MNTPRMMLTTDPPRLRCLYLTIVQLIGTYKQPQHELAGEEGAGKQRIRTFRFVLARVHNSISKKMGMDGRMDLLSKDGPGGI